MNGGFQINHCIHCQVTVEASLQECPLCGKKLTNTRLSVPRSYPAYALHNKSSYYFQLFWKTLVPLMFIGAFLIPSLITLLTGEGDLWLNRETLGIASAWVLVRYTFLSRMHMGKKFLLQIMNISLALFIFDHVGEARGWSVNYVIPFMLICSTLAMMYIVYKRKRLWSDYAVYVMTLIFLGFLPSFLYLIRVTSLLWPSAAAAGFAIVSLIAVYFFLDKNFRSYFNRRLHF